jgi:NAD(P)-dependent dehydrogenase (short-subunit alcohol dehydrogenase family)
MANSLIVGGTRGIGREIARHYLDRGDRVLLTGRDAEQAGKVATELGGQARGAGLDLARPHDIRSALSDLDSVDRVVLSGMERDQNKVAGYDIDAAVRLVTVKLVGYTAVLHALGRRLAPGGAVLLFGGQAMQRPYPGSTTVSTVNAGIVGLVNTLVLELAPVRVNAIHPGIVGDSPYWAGRAEYLAAVRQRTPCDRLATMADVVGAAAFLLENPAVNGVNLPVDGGWLLG